MLKKAPQNVDLKTVATSNAACTEFCEEKLPGEDWHRYLAYILSPDPYENWARLEVPLLMGWLRPSPIYALGKRAFKSGHMELQQSIFNPYKRLKRRHQMRCGPHLVPVRKDIFSSTRVFKPQDLETAANKGGVA